MREMATGATTKCLALFFGGDLLCCRCGAGCAALCVSIVTHSILSGLCFVTGSLHEFFGGACFFSSRGGWWLGAYVERAAMKVRLLVGLICCLLVSCGRARKPQKAVGEVKKSDVVWCRIQGPSVTVPNQKAEEWAIRRATFLYQTKAEGRKRCFLRAQFTRPAEPLHFSHGSQIPDPPREPVMEDVYIPDALFEELRAAGRRVAPASECVISRKGVKDRKTGEDGCEIFIVCDIRFLNATEAEVNGGWWTSPKSAASYTYVLKKIDGVWAVTGEHMTSVS